VKRIGGLEVSGKKWLEIENKTIHEIIA